MDKLDFKILYKPYYNPSAAAPEIVDVPAMQFLMVDGMGDPNASTQFEQAIDALYSISYTIKFGRKKAGMGPDFSVGALEGQWWMANGAEFDLNDKDSWLWTMMVWLPECITLEDVKLAVAELATKKPNPQYGLVRLETSKEGAAAQIMHVGPYAAEGPTVRRLHAFIADRGYRFNGKHREIYLGDPRRAMPEKLKTIIRQPVRPA
jgi:hypothetical protein